MRKILSKFFRKKAKISNNFICLPSSEVYKAITKKFLQENIPNHKKYSDRINSYLLWENFTFDHHLGSMEFSNDAEGFALALDREAIRQAEAMVKLNNEMTVITKILKDGSIMVNLNSSDYVELFTCSSIYWFKKP